jgi:uncharacterized protein (DUF1800 family)
MLSLPRSSVLLASVSTVLCAGASAVAQSSPTPVEQRPDRVVHVLNRLTFGPRPGEVERVREIGIERWIEQQLHPESIADSAGTAALSGCAFWTQPIDSIGSGPGQRVVQIRMADGIRSVLLSGNSLRLVTRDSARRAGARGAQFLENGQVIACRLARVEKSDRQLLEVMTDFWQNHFSIYSPKVPRREAIVEWDRAVIQPHALGRFRKLLGAVAHSPAMLMYLDNASSSAGEDQPTLTEYVLERRARLTPVTGKRPRERGLNENYARELLELHTLGVDGGYTQADVIAVARALTGWSTNGVLPQVPGTFRIAVRGSLSEMMGGSAPVRLNAAFVFDSSRHDAGPKVVLGHPLPAGRGMEDGEEVLDLLARHPSTARFIARKLAVRFVSDAPTDALIERAAATFLRTDGDIREVVRTIVTSPEFFSRDVYGVKIKSPLELVLSTRRALAAPVDTAAEIVDHLIAMDQPPFGQPTPDGWPETGADWMNARALLARLAFATNVAHGKFPAVPVESWPAWQRLSLLPFEQQVDGVIQGLLPGRAPAELRNAMFGLRPNANAAGGAETRQHTLRELIALALGSPAFQRR